MTQIGPNHQIDYIELSVTDVEKTKQFYNQVFGWTFTDYGPDYTSFSDGRLSGGFYLDEEHVPGKNPLVVIYARDLAGTLDSVKKNGGRTTQCDDQHHQNQSCPGAGLAGGAS